MCSAALGLLAPSSNSELNPATGLSATAAVLGPLFFTFQINLYVSLGKRPLVVNTPWFTASRHRHRHLHRCQPAVRLGVEVRAHPRQPRGGVDHCVHTLSGPSPPLSARIGPPAAQKSGAQCCFDAPFGTHQLKTRGGPRHMTLHNEMASCMARSVCSIEVHVLHTPHIPSPKE